MNKRTIGINKNYVKKLVITEIDKLFLEIGKMSDEIERLNSDKRRLEKSKSELANAYAREIGVIVTKREFKKLNESKNKSQERRKNEK